MHYRPRGLYRAKCPYYETDSRYTISCRGCGAIGWHRMVFENEQNKNQFLEQNCFFMPGQCPCEWQQFLFDREIE